MSKITDLLSKADRAEAQAQKAREAAAKAQAQELAERHEREDQFDSRELESARDRIQALYRERRECAARLTEAVIDSPWGREYVRMRQIDALLLALHGYLTGTASCLGVVVPNAAPVGREANLYEPVLQGLEAEARRRADEEFDALMERRKRFAGGEDE